MERCVESKIIKFEYYVKSLFSIAIHAVASSLEMHVDSLEVLPRHMKNKLLCLATKRGSASIEVLRCLLNPDVKNLDLSESHVSDETIQNLSVCTNLCKLDMNPGRNQIRNISTSALLALFPHLPNLSVLNMRRCPAVTDDVVCTVVDHCPLLKELDVGGCGSLTNRTLEKLKDLENLTSLNISASQVTDNGIVSLVDGKCRKTLNELWLDSCLGITDIAIETIVLFCDNMKILVFHGCPVTDASWFALQQLLSKTKVKQLIWTIH